MSFRADTRLDRERYSQSRPALNASCLSDDEDATVITITGVEEVEVPDVERADGKRVSLVIQSEQYPDKGYWVNAKGLDRIIERYGDIPAKWIGCHVPLEKIRTQNPKRPGAAHYSLWVCTEDTWDETLAAAGLSAAASKSARPTVAKPKKRRGR